MQKVFECLRRGLVPRRWIGWKEDLAGSYWRPTAMSIGKKCYSGWIPSS